MYIIISICDNFLNIFSMISKSTTEAWSFHFLLARFESEKDVDKFSSRKTDRHFSKTKRKTDCTVSSIRTHVAHRVGFSFLHPLCELKATSKKNICGNGQIDVIDNENLSIVFAVVVLGEFIEKINFLSITLKSHNSTSCPFYPPGA